MVTRSVGWDEEAVHLRFEESYARKRPDWICAEG